VSRCVDGALPPARPVSRETIAPARALRGSRWNLFGALGPDGSGGFQLVTPGFDVETTKVRPCDVRGGTSQSADEPHSESMLSTQPEHPSIRGPSPRRRCSHLSSRWENSVHHASKRPEPSFCFVGAHSRAEPETFHVKLGTLDAWRRPRTNMKIGGEPDPDYNTSCTTLYGIS